MLSLLVDQQNTHFNALLGTRLIIGIEKLQRLPAVLLDSDPTERSDEATSLSRCYLS